MQIVPRLIEKFEPKNYNLSLNLNRQDRKFNGTAVISGLSKSNDNQISFHSKDLNIESVTLDGKAAEFIYGENDELIITHRDLNKTNNIIVISYNGTITDAMHGLYPCYYDHNGIKKELLATQFESHHAREVFPCIDEPAAKATYDVTLTTEKDIIVLGNMPVKTQKIENDKLVTEFETTPIMSSYLLAWVVGELHKKTAFTKGGVEVNVWATPAQPSDSLDFALDIATRSIDFFDEYFGTPYPLSKSDHVALPDFSSGAMENWGLVTYREIALLADPKSTSIASRHYIATVIAHELSHQWFGNLVTMEWWNDLWLNESFASLVEYIAVDALEPSWNVWLDFDSSEVIAALRRDSLDGVQSVQMNVNHPDEIDTLFDGAIVYAKGARLLKMLWRYIGDEAFQSGLKEYFKIHAYKNTTAHDLWAAFEKVSHKNIESFMSAWISQPGFPVLNVNIQGDKILLSQNRLVSKSNTPSSALWPIPLNTNISFSSELFNKESASFAYKTDSLVKFNTNNDAHFITHYDEKILESMITELNNGNLSPIDRLQLLNEQNILASAGIIDSSTLIKLLESFKNEDSEAVWDIIGLTLNELKKFTDNNDMAEKKLRSLAESLAIKQYNRLGWNQKSNEPEADTKLRSLIVGFMSYSENPEVTATAINLYRSKPIGELDPELRSIIISCVVRNDGKQSDIDSLIELYKTSDSAELRQDICSGITSLRNIEQTKLILDLVKDTTTIRTQDTYRWIIYLMRNKHTRSITWQWIQDNWKWIDKTFSGDKSYDEYPRYVAMTLATEKQYDEYCTFFEPMKSNQALKRIIEIGINEIRSKIDTIERDGQSVCNALLNL